jgi:phage baseplate assembly protein gpV
VYRLMDAIKSHARALDIRRPEPRFAIVTSVDQQRAMAKVLLQPEGILTGWLPVLSPWVGPGWGFYSPPSAGDQVFVIPQEGDAQQGVIVGRAFSSVQLPPSTPPGEIWLRHSSGTSIKLANDGTVRIAGDLHVSGDIYDSTGSLSQLRNSFDRHVHTDSRGGQTSQPNPQV